MYIMKQKFIHSLLAFAILVAPLQVLAAPSVTAADTIAGVGTEVSVIGLTEGEQADVVILPPVGPEVLGNVSATNSVVHINGADTETAGIYDVLIEKNGIEIAQTTFNVLPDTVDTRNSTIQSDKTQFSLQDDTWVTVILRDRFGNPLEGRPVELISNRVNDYIQAATAETNVDGEMSFVVSTNEAGTISLRAMDLLSNKVLDTQLSLQAGTPTGVGGYYDAPYPAQQPYYAAPQPYYYPPQGYYAPTTPAPTATNASRYNGNQFVGQLLGRKLYGQAGTFDLVDHFEIRAKQEMKTNEDETIVILALDRNGNKVEDYTGVALLSSTDEYAFLPLNGEIQFQPQNLGEKVLTLGLRFRNPGEQILYVEDNTDPNINGQLTIQVTGEGVDAEGQIKVTSHRKDDYINSTNIVLEGTGPPFLNLVITGGSKDYRSETDADGFFSVEMKLNPDQMDHTLRIRDESSRFDSGDIHLIYDEDAPEVGLINFSPEEPEVDEKVLVVVESEPGLGSVTVQIGEETYSLEEQSASGSYNTIFDAPESGSYQPIIIATDDGGNATEIRSNLEVKASGLPQVQGVIATPSSNSVDLEWAAIETETVDGYRIYVGETEDDFLYTLDTNRPITTASVAGLRPGKTYYFSVTALKDDRESAPKSEVVSATVLGVELNITPEDSALLIEWSSLEEGVPLSSFLLEYGIEPDTFLEQRNLSGDLRAFTLRDLLNDVTYYLRITPITTTGDILRDMAPSGQGTPNGSGFKPAAHEPAPFEPERFPSTPTPTPTTPPPATPETGIAFSGWWFAIAASMLLLGLHVRRRKTLATTDAFFHDMEARYRS